MPATSRSMPVDVDVAADGEVGPPAHLRGQVDQRRVLPDSVHHVDRVAIGAVLLGTVEVVHPLEPVRDRRLDESPQRRRQLVVGPLPYRQRTRPPVVGVVTGGSVLQQLEGREHVGERPALGAVLAPLGEVSGARSDRDARVHRGTAAEHLAPRGRDPRRLVAASRGIAPVVIRVRDPAGVQQRGRIGVGGVSVAGLKQQDRSRGILAQAAREDRASGTAANDNHVGGLGRVGHANLLVSRLTFSLAVPVPAR